MPRAKYITIQNRKTKRVGYNSCGIVACVCAYLCLCFSGKPCMHLWP